VRKDSKKEDRTIVNHFHGVSSPTETRRNVYGQTSSLCHVTPGYPFYIYIYIVFNIIFIFYLHIFVFLSVPLTFTVRLLHVDSSSTLVPESIIRGGWVPCVWGIYMWILGHVTGMGNEFTDCRVKTLSSFLHKVGVGVCSCEVNVVVEVVVHKDSFLGICRLRVVFPAPRPFLPFPPALSRPFTTTVIVC
jgi:hypothetical protein